MCLPRSIGTGGGLNGLEALLSCLSLSHVLVMRVPSFTPTDGAGTSRRGCAVTDQDIRDISRASAVSGKVVACGSTQQCTTVTGERPSA